MKPGDTHLLALPDDVTPDDLTSLALSRYPAARWETVPDDEPGLLRLTRHTHLRGPYLIDADGCEALSIGARPLVYAVHTVRERTGRPFPGATDRDGIARAFADGEPFREEGRITRFLLAVSRRLGGALRIADSGAVLAPDPVRSVNLSIHSDVWLEPEAAVAVLASVQPSARLVMEGEPWAGPEGAVERGDVIGPGVVSEDERRRIAAFSAAWDARALAQPETRSVYGLAAALGRATVGDSGLPGGLGGLVGPDRGEPGLGELDLGEAHVLVGGDETPPQVLAGVEWTAGGVITYQVVWAPSDPEQLDREFPTASHRAAARVVHPLIEEIAIAFHRAVAGEITDPDGFLVALT